MSTVTLKSHLFYIHSPFWHFTSAAVLSHHCWPCWPESLHLPGGPSPASAGQDPWQPASGAEWPPAGWPGPPRLGRWGCTEATGRCPPGGKGNLWLGFCCCVLPPDFCPSSAGHGVKRCLWLENSSMYCRSVNEINRKCFKWILWGMNSRNESKKMRRERYLLVMTVWERHDGANTALEDKVHLWLVEMLKPEGLWGWKFSCELTWHLLERLWAPNPGSGCTATAHQRRFVLPCRCFPPAAAPHQTATAPQTEELPEIKKTKNQHPANLKFGLIV